jgi:hypothetical protein
MAMTGRFDFRKSLLSGKIVLRVEEEVKALWSRSGERPMKKRWRDATLVDLTTPEMRTLIDARFRPNGRNHRIEVDGTSALFGTNVAGGRTV